MKKVKIMILLLIIFFILSLLIYNNSSSYIKNNEWKTFSDTRIGDWISFGDKSNDYYYLDWPKVYKDGEHVGYVVFCLYDKLWIYKIKDDNDTGLGICEYISK